MTLMDADYAALVGIDWGDEKHDVYVMSPNGRMVQQDEILQTAESIAGWVSDLRTQFGGRPVAVCLEQSRGALVYALMQYDFLVLYLINPKQLSSYRDAIYPSGAKDDPNDAELLAHFLRHHPHKLRAWQPDDEITRALRLLTEQRRKWVGARVARVNELQQRLKESYPLALTLSKSFSKRSFLALLKKFPTQQDLQRASPKQLEKWLPKQRRVVDDPPKEQMLREQIEKIRKAPGITTDRAVIEHSRLAIYHLAVFIQNINEAIDQCDEQIAKLYEEHADAELFKSFPCAADALAPRLAAAFGTDRNKMHDAQEMQQLSGIAPVIRASGKTTIVHMRWACPKFLRQTFHEYARCSIKKSRWAWAYKEMRKKRGDDIQEIYRGLAFKWQRILFRCWKTKTLYDEDRYIRQLRAKGSDLIPLIEKYPGRKISGATT